MDQFSEEIVTDQGGAPVDDDQLRAELTAMQAQFMAIEDALVSRTLELENARTESTQAARRTRDLETRLAQATARYRQALLLADPTVPPEMVAGQTVEEIDRSVQHAKGVVAQIRAQVQREGERAATELPPELLANMTPDQKIRYGLSRRTP
jgi:hypothetical protein